MTDVVLKGVALVSGAASGIGRATAERLHQDGWAVVGADVREEPGLVACDVTSTASVESAVAQCLEEHGSLDAVVNAAGTGFPLRFLEASDEDWQTMLDVNLMGTVRVCRAALPHLRRSTQPGRGIVNFTSQAAKTGGLLIGAPYSAAKAAVLCLTKTSRRRSSIRCQASASAERSFRSAASARQRRWPPSSPSCFHRMPPT